MDDPEHGSIPVSISLKMKQPYEHSSFSVSSSLKNESDLYKHSLLLVSSLCKNETYEHSYTHLPAC